MVFESHQCIRFCLLSGNEQKKFNVCWSIEISLSNYYYQFTVAVHFVLQLQEAIFRPHRRYVNWKLFFFISPLSSLKSANRPSDRVTNRSTILNVVRWQKYRCQRITAHIYKFFFIENYSSAFMNRYAYHLSTHYSYIIDGSMGFIFALEVSFLSCL